MPSNTRARALQVRCGLGDPSCEMRDLWVPCCKVYRTAWCRAKAGTMAPPILPGCCCTNALTVFFAPACDPWTVPHILRCHAGADLRAVLVKHIGAPLVDTYMSVRPKPKTLPPPKHCLSGDRLLLRTVTVCLTSNIGEVRHRFFLSNSNRDMFMRDRRSLCQRLRCGCMCKAANYVLLLAGWHDARSGAARTSASKASVYRALGGLPIP